MNTQRLVDRMSSRREGSQMLLSLKCSMAEKSSSGCFSMLMPNRCSKKSKGCFGRTFYEAQILLFHTLQFITTVLLYCVFSNFWFFPFTVHSAAPGGHSCGVRTATGRSQNGQLAVANGHLISRGNDHCVMLRCSLQQSVWSNLIVVDHCCPALRFTLRADDRTVIQFRAFLHYFEKDFDFTFIWKEICQGLFYPEQTILSRTCA